MGYRVREAVRESPPSPAWYEARQRAIAAVQKLRCTQDGDVFDLIADLQAEVDRLKQEKP